MTTAEHGPQRSTQHPEAPATAIDPLRLSDGSPENHHEVTSTTALTAEEGGVLLGQPEERRKTPREATLKPGTDEARVAAHFANDTSTHKLTVHREDGVFRHLEFTGLSGISRIRLVTWPYNLLVTGSHGSYHFERFGPDTEDMLNWIRGSRPDPNSWASKLVNGRRFVEEYDRTRLESKIRDLVAEAVQDGRAPAGLESAVREEILDSHWMDDEQNALRLVGEFQLGMQYRSECSCGEGAEHDSYDSAACWNLLTHKGKGDGHKVRVRQTSGFMFDDFAEWNIHRLNYHFLYQCHAAVWAVAQYDAARATQPLFFQPGRIYAHTEFPQASWRFRCDSITTHPEDGERTALGWRIFKDAWEPYAYGEDDWDPQLSIGQRDGRVAGEVLS
ncbi:hypothetical protein [Streptomyces tsukubensis]|uniref:hypothetical protein n=1 Tax=Streptomyces tsukubensis TaxID=83656 RepID=UPI00344D2E05